MDFLKRGLKVDYDIIIDIIEVFSGFPFVSSLVKLGMLGNKYFELQFIRKVSRWKNSQSYQLNEFGLRFYEILKAHDWFDE